MRFKQKKNYFVPGNTRSGFKNGNKNDAESVFVSVNCMELYW